MDRTQYVPGEAVPVAVRLVNNSGQTMHFGAEDWVSFTIEGRGGMIVPKAGDPPLVHDFDLPASERATQHVDLQPYFELAKPGHYTVTASVRIKDWSAEMTSKAKGFDIINGTPVWEQEFGVPQSSPTNHALPEIRKYALQQATFANSMKLYFRLTDSSDAKSLRVYALGPMISFSNPQEKLDDQSNLHILYQTGSRIYNYSVITPDGNMTTHQTFVYGQATPRLGTERKSGKIVVVGGVRKISPDDIPKPDPAHPPEPPPFDP